MKQVLSCFSKYFNLVFVVERNLNCVWSKTPKEIKTHCHWTIILRAIKLTIYIARNKFPNKSRGTQFIASSNSHFRQSPFAWMRKNQNVKIERQVGAQFFRFQQLKWFAKNQTKNGGVPSGCMLQSLLRMLHSITSWSFVKSPSTDKWGKRSTSETEVRGNADLDGLNFELNY